MEELEELNRILGDDNEVKNIIADQLKKIAMKYGQERKTTLISGEEITEYNETENIDDYPLTIFVTRDNYIKNNLDSKLIVIDDFKYSKYVWSGDIDSNYFGKYYDLYHGYDENIRYFVRGGMNND